MRQASCFVEPLALPFDSSVRCCPFVITDFWLYIMNWFQRLQAFQPKAGVLDHIFFLCQCELPGIYDLVRFAVSRAHDTYRVFYRNLFTVSIDESHEKLYCLFGLFRVLTSPAVSAVCQSRARRMSDNQIPFIFNDLQCICLDMPFGMSTGTVLYVATVRLMPSRPECFTHFLAFLTRYKNFHVILPFRIFHISSRIARYAAAHLRGGSPRAPHHARKEVSWEKSETQLNVKASVTADAYRAGTHL